MFDEDTPPWVRTAVLTAIAVVAVVVACAVVLVIKAGDHGTTGRSTTQATSTANPASTSVCGLPDGDQTIPQIAPDAAWVEVGSLSMPSSPKFGPGLVRGDQRSCFAHSPTGAIFAAMNPPRPTTSNDEGLQYAGFRMDDFTPARTTVQLAFAITRGPRAGTMFAIPGIFAWKHGDWFDESGTNATPQLLTTLNGFTPFGPGGQ